MTTTPQVEEAAVLAAVRDGNEAVFVALAERHRRSLHVHCYRMLGSFEDAEDLVQETFLRAWRGRASFEGRSQFGTWLYRIATNACLNALARARRRVTPQEAAPPASAPTADLVRGVIAHWSGAAQSGGRDPRQPEIAWLGPYPDRLLEPVAPREDQPDAAFVSRETIELAFLAAIQHLPPRQRAVLILRDVLDWSAKETAALLEASVPSVNSALQRARSTLRAVLPEGGADRRRAVGPTDEERSLVRTFMDALEQGDAAALTAILREDAQLSMPPVPLWLDGRASIVAFVRALVGPDAPGGFRFVPAAGANGQPAVASYYRLRGDSAHRLCGLKVFRVKEGRIAEIVNFGPELCGAFNLPPAL
jgi:RNA polymerase sigma-70 factor (ECF subfamily)